ncbi:MAG TPA: phospholipase D-like domain-containing protein, partial [Candidatus Ozemobacteraceae bacterium]|nr:phospholipase D-like domain-containing protein [Candidatus Ozemobacteraceae bacterium]
MNLCSRTTIAAALLAVMLASHGIGEAAPRTDVSRQPINVAFGPSTPEAEGLDDAFISFVDAAESTLDMAFYEIRLDNIVDALIRAHKRGVAIRLVVDNDNYLFRQAPVEEGDEEADPAGNEEQILHSGSRAAAVSPKLNPFIQRLVDAGIQVHDDENRAALMHNKFAVRDGRWVWTGSYNLTDTCSYRNVNNAVWIDSPELAEVYTAELEEMYEKHQFGISSPRLASRREIKVGTA